MTKDQILKELAEVRKEYSEWKKSNPDIQNELEINKFLMYKGILEDKGLKFEWKDTEIDKEAKEFLKVPKVAMIQSYPKEMKFREDDFAKVYQSGNEQFEFPIKLDEIKNFFKPFVISSPVTWVVGGVVTNKKDGSKNDIDFLISLPDSEQIKRIVSFRLNRMFPPEVRNRLSFLFENKFYHGCFTDNLPLYRLVMEPIYDAKIEKMAEIRLRTKGTERQAEQATDAATEDKITWGEFFLPQKPMRGYRPGEQQSIDNFLKLFNKKNYPIFSSYKADGLHCIFHVSDNDAVVYTEDGIDETSSFPQTIEKAKKLAPGHKFIVLAEVEFWKDKQHFPREVAAGKIHKIVPDEEGIIANVYDIVYFDKDIHFLSFVERLDVVKKLKFKQSTETPSAKYKWNLIPHKISNNEEELESETKRLSNIKHSEGNVAKSASAKYDLTGRRPDLWIKYHKSIIFNAICMGATETKTPGVYTLKWALLPSDRIYSKEVMLYDDLRDTTVIYGGKTFSTKDKPSKFSVIKIECETFNLINNEKTDTYSISAWAPRYLEKSNEEPDTVKDVEKKAIKNRLFQAKILKKSGSIVYLPGKTSVEIFSKQEPFSESDNDKGLKIKFLGTKGLIEESGPGHKYHTSIILSDGQTKIMIDYGKLNQGLDVVENENPDYVLISHGHPDHVCEEILNFSIEKKRKIFASRHTFKSFDNKKMLGDLGSNVFKNKEPFNLGKFKITPCQVLHSVLHPMTIFAIENKGIKIVLSTDILGFHSGDREKIFKDADVWIADGSSITKDLIRYHKEKKEPYGHTAFVNSIKWLKDNKPLILLTHLGKQAIEMGDDNINKMLRNKYPDKKIVVCKDNQIIVAKPLMLE